MPNVSPFHRYGVRGVNLTHQGFLAELDSAQRIRQGGSYGTRETVRTSARNQFPGKIVSVEKGSVGAIVKIDTDSPCRVTAYITKEAADDLGLKKGDRVVAIVKATEVMVGKD